jgi:hypothetical protein
MQRTHASTQTAENCWERTKRQALDELLVCFDLLRLAESMSSSTALQQLKMSALSTLDMDVWRWFSQ